jgi:hypothetical protein
VPDRRPPPAPSPEDGELVWGQVADDSRSEEGYAADSRDVGGPLSRIGSAVLFFAADQWTWALDGGPAAP